jgi:hypothetical protein
MPAEPNRQEGLGPLLFFAVRTARSAEGRHEIADRID